MDQVPCNVIWFRRGEASVNRDTISTSSVSDWLVRRIMSMAADPIETKVAFRMPIGVRTRVVVVGVGLLVVVTKEENNNRQATEQEQRSGRYNRWREEDAKKVSEAKRAE